MVVKVTLDKSPVADLKRPFKNRLRHDSAAAGAIELAYLRGEQAGFERAAAAARRHGYAANGPGDVELTEAFQNAARRKRRR